MSENLNLGAYWPLLKDKQKRTSGSCTLSFSSCEALWFECFVSLAWKTALSIMAQFINTALFH